MAKRVKKMVVPQKTFDSTKSFQSFIETEKEWMYERIYESIKSAHNTGGPMAFVLEAKIEDSMSIVSIKSDEDEWVNTLSIALEWYINQEMYEKCAQLRDLISEIQGHE